MSHWLENFFSRRTDGGLILRNGSACHHTTSQGAFVYQDRYTVLDSYYYVETMVAKYTVICESQATQPHKIDTFDITIVTNKDNTVYTVFNRVYTNRKLVEIDVQQDNSEVYLKIQEITYAGEVSDRVKVSLIRNYVTAGGTS